MVLRLTVRPEGVPDPPTPDEGQGGTALPTGVTGGGDAGLQGIPEGGEPAYPATAGEVAASGGSLERAAPSVEAPGRPATGPELDEIYRETPPDEDMAPALTRRHHERSQIDRLFSMADKTMRDPWSLLIGMAEAGTLGDNKLAQDAAEQARERNTFLESLKKVGADVGMGVIEAPRQIMGGARDAAQSVVNLIGWLGDRANDVVDLDALVGLEPKAGKTTEMPALPTVKKPKTTTGEVVRGISQFLTGFAAAGGAIGATAGAGFTGAAVKGFLSDAVAFEAQEKRLSDLVQQYPQLQNPVTEYLSHSGGNENEIEGRLKRAVEGLGLGAAAQGLFLGLKAFKSWRNARAAEDTGADVSTAAALARAEGRDAAPLAALGDAAETAPLMVRASAKADAAAKATGDLGVPGDVAAAAVSTKGLTPLGEAKDVYINFARINTTEDVKRVIADVAEGFKGDISDAARGVRTNTETVEAAAKLDAWDILLKRRTSEPLNAEQSVAVRQLWEASGSKLLEISEMAAKNPSAENLFQFRKMLATHYAVQREVVAARTETARALQSWAIPAGGSKSVMRDLEDTIMKSGGMEMNAAFAARVAALNKVPGGIAALDDLVERSVLARSLDAVKEAWIMALLSGPKTHLVNMMSNTTVMGQQVIERAAAAKFSQVVGSGDIHVGEATAQVFGLISGLKDGLRYAGKSFMTGESGFGMGKIELPFQRAISAARLAPGAREDSWAGKAIDGLGTIINLPGRALMTSDEFFKTVGFRMELHAQAHRMATREITDGKISASALKSRIADIVANPPENIRLNAIDQAAYQTFTNAPGALVKKLGQLEAEWAQSGPGGQLGATLMKFLIPFRNTPANIFKYTFERTPLAPLTSRYRDAIAEGGAAADIARTRMALGTMTVLLATDLAMDGHLTGSGPDKKDRGERGALSRTGWQQYSIKHGDRYYAYNRMDPVGFTLGIGADLAEYIKGADFNDSTGTELQKAAFAAMLSIGNNALNKNYLRGLSDFMEAINEPSTKGPRWGEKILAAYVPTAMAETARAIDPYMRETHDLISKMKARTPGLSSDLPMARDLWGRPRTFESGLGKTYDAISPIYSRKEDAQPIDKAMLAQDWALGMPPKKIAGENVSAHPEVFSRYLELRGQVKPSEMGGDQSKVQNIGSKRKKGEAAPDLGENPDATKLIKAYGDKPMLEALNELAGNLKGDDLEAAARKAVKAYGAAAREKVKKEFPKVFGGAGKKSDDDE